MRVSLFLLLFVVGLAQSAPAPIARLARKTNSFEEKLRKQVAACGYHLRNLTLGPEGGMWILVFSHLDDQQQPLEGHLQTEAVQLDWLEKPEELALILQVAVLHAEWEKRHGRFKR